ncbi:MAG TPA: hypothetical protein VJU78_03090 [Chitinophagaceae bacterium]|nr:hypothetical protein [Chitinophagaceae bacterium]
MSIRWKLFRAICIVQMIAAAVNVLDILFNFFRYASWTGLIGLILFTAILLLTILAVNLLNNNYPDDPVEGRQKKSFNRLFLINFLFLAFLFGFVIAEIRSLNKLIISLGISSLPRSIFLMLFVYSVMLILQLIILYGLYKLRLELYSNFMKRKFEFENLNSI